MTGVEILAMEEIVTDSVFNWTVFWIVLGVLFGVFIISGIIISVVQYDWSVVVVGVFLGLFAGIFFGSLSGNEASIPTEYKTQYKVTISDEVSMNEFLEIYEIIDQEGKIYTVRERNEVSE